MALHFGKRESELPKPLNSGVTAPRYGANPTMPSGQSPQATPAPADPVPPAVNAKSNGTESGGSKLTVGPNIKLKGVEITDCDTLVVEGMVEATMDSRVIQIAEQGEFKGSAEIDLAEIHGVFDGSLTVRQKLVIHSTGRVTGKIRYGKVVIEEGGQLSGDIECTVPGAARTSSSATANKPSMALAA